MQWWMGSGINKQGAAGAWVDLLCPEIDVVNIMPGGYDVETNFNKK